MVYFSDQTGHKIKTRLFFQISWMQFLCILYRINTQTVIGEGGYATCPAYLKKWP